LGLISIEYQENQLEVKALLNSAEDFGLEDFAGDFIVIFIHSEYILRCQILWK